MFVQSDLQVSKRFTFNTTPRPPPPLLLYGTMLMATSSAFWRFDKQAPSKFNVDREEARVQPTTKCKVQQAPTVQGCNNKVEKPSPQLSRNERSGASKKTSTFVPSWASSGWHAACSIDRCLCGGGSLIESQSKRATYTFQQIQDADVPIPEEEALDRFE